MPLGFVTGCIARRERHHCGLTPHACLQHLKPFLRLADVSYVHASTYQRITQISHIGCIFVSASRLTLSPSQISRGSLYPASRAYQSTLRVTYITIAKTTKSAIAPMSKA